MWNENIGCFPLLESKGGHLQAIVATAHKLAKIFFTMVKFKTPYDEKKVGLDEAELLKRKINRAQVMLDRLNKKYKESSYYVDVIYNNKNSI